MSVLEVVVERLAAPGPPPDAARYRTLFLEHVVANADPNQDDLLFFVRKSPPSTAPSPSPSPTPTPSASASSLSRGGRPPAAPTGPPSDEVLFVKRRTAARTVVLSPEEDADVRWKETLYLNLLVQLHCELTVAVCTKTALPDGRSTMHAQRHVTKRVYASPSKTRMHKKGHEYSYAFPLIFFNVEDFEDAFSNLVINDAEYLCVELRVRLPARDGSGGSSSSSASTSGGPADRSVTIFQGAVSWDAIHSTFQRQTTPKSIWERVEYIMMRGPKSKGHCQVAVSITDEAAAEGPASAAASPSPSGTLRGLVKMAQQMALVLADRPLQIKQLKCCLTFVNVSWQAIVNDLSQAILGPGKASALVVDDAAP